MKCPKLDFEIKLRIRYQFVRICFRAFYSFFILENTMYCNLFRKQSMYSFTRTIDLCKDNNYVCQRSVSYQYPYRYIVILLCRELKLFVCWTHESNLCHSRILNDLFCSEKIENICPSGMQFILEFNYKCVTTSLSLPRDFPESSEYCISIFTSKTAIFAANRESLLWHEKSTKKWDFNINIDM